MTTDLSKASDTNDQDVIDLLQQAGMEKQAELHQKLLVDPVRTLSRLYSEVTDLEHIILPDGCRRVSLSGFEASDVSFLSNEGIIWLKLVIEAKNAKHFPDGIDIYRARDVNSPELLAIGCITDATGMRRKFLIAPLNVSIEEIKHRIDRDEERKATIEALLAEIDRVEAYRYARRAKVTHRVATWSDRKYAPLDLLWISIASTVPFLWLSWWYSFLIFAFYTLYVGIGLAADHIAHRVGKLGSSGYCDFNTKHTVPKLPPKPRTLMSKRELRNANAAQT